VTRDEEIERIEISAGEHRFTARAAGPEDGELVLLLHGFPETSYEWRNQLPALAAAGYRAVAPDLRGYSPGARPEGVEWYRATHLVADVLAFADWLGGHNFYLVGHDWGAAIAWQVAGRHPDRLRSLTIVSVPHPGAFGTAIADDPDQQQRSGYVQFFQQDGGVAEQALLENDAAALRALFTGFPDDAVEEYVSALQQPGAMTAALNYYRATDLALLQGMGPITMPTMYVWSTGDVALGRTAAEGTARHVDGPYRFEVLDGVSHWIPEDAAEALNRLLLEHLQSGSEV